MRSLRCAEVNGCPSLTLIERAEDKECVTWEQALSSYESAVQDFATILNNQHDPFNLRLPVELACRILHLCMPVSLISENFRLDSHREKRRPCWRKPCSTRLRLGAVCQRWRHILWSDPSFWDFLPVIIKRRTPMTRLELLKEWLDRSGQLALTLCVDFGRNKSMPSAELSRALGILLSQYMHRCSGFYTNSPAILMNHLLSEKPPAVQVLVLETPLLAQSTTTNDEQGNLSYKFDLGMFPSPEVVSLTDYQLSSVQIRWDHVTRFEDRLSNRMMMMMMYTNYYLMFNTLWCEEVGWRLPQKGAEMRIT
ncbi:hypothetical protein CPB83DRAFT_861569 [Crepidotus variabilis]|uniref:F-box domain-containing protein n=1 Tax=Crepidotus variabilis TaxID=179855 RepID=A0A9P6JKZ4_9AGAR|nr:hypothetical protein CPB83DRAFT_861569 [Crepidotus variabilis]